MFKINNNIYQAIKDFIVKNRRVIVTLVHLMQAALANYLAFVLRLESILLPANLNQLLTYLPILLFIRLVFYLQAGLYKSHLRYSGIHDLIKIIRSITFGSITFFIIIRYLIGDTSYPLSIYILDFLLLLIISGGSRLSIRMAFGRYLPFALCLNFVMLPPYPHSCIRRECSLVVALGEGAATKVRAVHEK